MSYTAWSVVFGEVPSETKWNTLGANDDSFNDGTGIDDDVIIQRHFADGQVDTVHLDAALQDYKELGRDTLTGTGTELEVVFAAKKYLMIIISLVANASGLDGWITFNGDTGANYAERYSSNHGADTTGASAVQLDIEVGNVLADGAYLSIQEWYNPSGSDKIGLNHSAHQTALTAATPPNSSDMQYTWNSSAQISSVRFFTDQAMKAGADLIVLGHD